MSPVPIARLRGRGRGPGAALILGEEAKFLEEVARAKSCVEVEIRIRNEVKERNNLQEQIEARTLEKIVQSDRNAHADSTVVLIKPDAASNTVVERE